MEDKNNSFLAIVGIVAIVAIVVMISFEGRIIDNPNRNVGQATIIVSDYKYQTEISSEDMGGLYTGRGDS